ncbi:universal stress protein [Olsenella uli]|uniref:universal stress protein n=1 Tax=Olsenella uli TaxID=133926 RepID=UPI00195D5D65|nr:universal stress protein [Olsenella uli]MBM6815989.1 universal stress protein [Olsenella uli]
MADTAAQTYEDLGYDRIFVSLDGSDQQDKVLDRAILLAANDNAELYIGHVIDSTALEAAGTFPVDIVPSLEKEFRASIEAKVRAAEANPSIKKVEVIVRSGRIRETIKDEMLDVINPDLVICGARGLSSIKYAILGSISTFLTRNTECDTLVIK